MSYNKKRGIIEGWKTIWSLTVGSLLIILGLFPILNQLGVISWQLPSLPRAVLEIILAVAGIYLLIDGIFELGMHPSLGFLSIISGLIVAVIGILSLLGNLKILAVNLSFIPALAIHIVIVLAGILIFLGSFMF